MDLVSSMFPCCHWLKWLQKNSQENQRNLPENDGDDCDDDDDDLETNRESNGMELEDVQHVAEGQVENCSSSDSSSNRISNIPSSSTKVLGDDSLESTLLDSNSGNST